MNFLLSWIFASLEWFLLYYTGMKKITKSKGIILSIFMILYFGLIGLEDSRAAPLLDLGWGPPVLIPPKTGKSQKYTMIWPIQISNSTPHRISPSLDVVAVTNTGRQYNFTSTEKTALFNSSNLSDIQELNSAIFPSANRRAYALFDDFDPKATVINFYVGGVLEGDSENRKHATYIQIIYHRTESRWEWISANLFE